MIKGTAVIGPAGLRSSSSALHRLPTKRSRIASQHLPSTIASSPSNCLASFLDLSNECEARTTRYYIAREQGRTQRRSAKKTPAKIGIGGVLESSSHLYRIDKSRPLIVATELADLHVQRYSTYDREPRSHIPRRADPIELRPKRGLCSCLGRIQGKHFAALQEQKIRDKINERSDG